VDHSEVRSNDRFGHLAGDKVLRLISRSNCPARLRKSDFIGRFGGEEFRFWACCQAPRKSRLTPRSKPYAEGIEESPFHFKTERVTYHSSVYRVPAG